MAISPFFFVTLLLQRVFSQQHDYQHVLSTGNAAVNACHELAVSYPDKTISISDPEYSSYQFNYWSRQQFDLKPTCRFLPSNAEDVHLALQVLHKSNASFAISSGGHTSNPGFSNINSGVTIDLSSLNQIRVTDEDDKAAVWIGPGARWGDVYRALEPERLTVAGARVSHVGVGGFVLGGGISWYANQVGWSCDSVLAFEVVTPDLQIRRVDRNKHADLFWALKGSAGTFGVVTGIKMRAIETSPVAGVYAGAVAFKEEELPRVLSVLAKTSTDAEHDQFTSSGLSFGYLPANKEFVYNAYIVNTAGQDDTSSLKEWKSIPNIHSSLRHTTILESADEITEGNPLGLRRSKFTFTTAPQLEKVAPLHTLFRNFAMNLDLDSEGLLGMNFQPLMTPMLNISASSLNPNIFSETLVQDMIPLLVVTVELWWSDSNKDVEFEGLMKSLAEEMLGPKGVGWAKHVWIYPNYAAAWQEPFAEWRLGVKTFKKLLEVKNLYDPKDMWTMLRPGLWHV
jgi:hypothetical protein